MTDLLAGLGFTIPIPSEGVFVLLLFPEQLDFLVASSPKKHDQPDGNESNRHTLITTHELPAATDQGTIGRARFRRMNQNQPLRAQTWIIRSITKIADRNLFLYKPLRYQLVMGQVAQGQTSAHKQLSPHLARFLAQARKSPSQ